MSKVLDPYALRMDNICKSFAGVKALDAVKFNVRPGEVHALMGENGAGKSTLMKILTGINQKDEGSILINGQPVDIKTPKDALDCGISMIHQELNPILDMTVAENLFLGKEPCYKGTIAIINKKAENELASSLFKQIGININPQTKISSLTIAQIQMVEIVKAVSSNSRIIIMDEPTSAISVHDTAKLFEIIKGLKAKGVAIIFISHKMDEIFTIADTITVFRDGKYIATKPALEFNSSTLITLMVGRELDELFPKKECAIGQASLEVKNLNRKGKFRDINFTAHEGEILGFAGLVGAGRSEIMESIFGIASYDSGTIKVNDAEVLITSPADALKLGIAFITEDRKQKGLNLKGSVKTNMTLSSLKDYCVLQQLIKPQKENSTVDNEIERIGIKTSGRNQLVSTLSGGNQQKVVLSKWLLTNPQILILDEPTRGIDVGAKAEIYKLISSLVMQKKTVILISSEMPELLGLCDRIIVLHEGAIISEFKRGQFNAEAIMEAAMATE